MSFTVRIDMTRLESYFSDFFPWAIKYAKDKGLQDVATVGQAIMVIQAPHRTGDLARSITVTKEGEAYVIAPTVPYAVYVERGTRPHEIVARHARALHFVWRGSPVFFRRVMHPGTQPNPFIARSREKVRNIAADMMAATLKEILR